MRSCDSLAKRAEPQLMLCCNVIPKGDQVKTLHTLWTTPSDTIYSSLNVSVRLHMLMVPNSEVEILSILKLT